jgi:hypothetical protein
MTIEHRALALVSVNHEREPFQFAESSQFLKAYHWQASLWDGH